MLLHKTLYVNKIVLRDNTITTINKFIFIHRSLYKICNVFWDFALRLSPVYQNVVSFISLYNKLFFYNSINKCNISKLLNNMCNNVLIICVNNSITV